MPRPHPPYLRRVRDTPEETLAAPRPEGRPARRRARSVRLAALGALLAAVLAADGWLLHTRARYLREDARLRAAMTADERARADALLAREASRLRRLQLELALLRRQATADRALHLAVALDSGVMHLERDGAILRDIPVQVGPERRVGTPPDTVHLAAPRGTRLVERLVTADSGWEVPAWVYADRGIAVPSAAERTVRGGLGAAAVVLSGGTVIYVLPAAGPLNDPAYVLPGSLRTRAADLEAVLPSLRRGLRVYLY